MPQVLIFNFSILAVATSAFAGTCELTSDVAATLKACIPGIEVKSTSPANPDPNRTYFDLSFEQPIDHQNPKAGMFRQRLVLAHKNYSEPMVLQTSGYSIFGINPSMLAKTFDTNQIQVEHRFFKDSSPKPLDWSKLDIRQSADDFHRITEAFKKVYTKSWVGTGASKGGMTSVYHRRFYPGDLDGTIADVAPLSFSTWDDRYVDFIDNVGGAIYTDCRAKLAAVQTYMLEHRDYFQTFLGGEYTHLGSRDIAYEHSLQEMPFYFWQYHSPTDEQVGCDHIPTAGVESKAFLAFYNEISPLEKNYEDGGIFIFLPYFYQAATQLGSPAIKRSHLKDLLKYEFNINQYAPKQTEIAYSNTAMKDVASWVESQGQGMIFTYGEFDPWTAGRFPESCTNDCHWFNVPAGNHSAKIFKLEGPEKQKAYAIVGRWMKKEVPTDSWEPSTSFDTSLDSLEFNYLKKSALR